MAEKRMFAKSVVWSGVFLDLPLTAQAVYFHLSMQADDEGFLDNVQPIMRMIGAKRGDLALLIEKGLVLQPSERVFVIAHWRVNNYLRNDRQHATLYTKERDGLILNEKGIYEQKNPCLSGKNDDGIPTVYQRYGQNSIEENSIYNIYSRSDEQKEPVKHHSRDECMKDACFLQFWNAYPRKTNKKKAVAAWNRMQPNEKLFSEIMTALEEQKKQAQWNRDDGQYIPHAATWLNGRRWEDEFLSSKQQQDKQPGIVRAPEGW